MNPVIMSRIAFLNNFINQDENSTPIHSLPITITTYLPTIHYIQEASKALGIVKVLIVLINIFSYFVLT